MAGVAPIVYSRDVNSSAPSVYAFLDFRAYLGAWFSWKKDDKPGYSHRLFARQAGQRSPSLLKAVIDGKRNLTPATQAGFSVAIGHDAEEADFFGALVTLGQARSDEERNAAWSVISAERRFRAAHRIEGEAFRFFSHWYCVAVFELVKHPDFRPDPRWVARTLRPKVSESTARQALRTLRELSLIREDEDGTVHQTQASVVTPHEVKGLAVANYYREMCARASESVTAFEAGERHLLSVTVTVPPDLIPVLKRELNALQNRILDLCDSADDRPGRVTQINLQLFPLAARLPDD
ncbi:MAG TPA: hypothetical protein DFR83_12630 [Deltaproteobacteria bacterium]|nr:hypothetical protein [Deltaproteobacteria bacterium]